MRVRAAVAALGIGAGSAAIIVTSGAGQAAAFTTEIIPELGLYSVELDHSETVALRNSPLPGMLDPLWRDHGVAFVVPSSAASTDEVIFGDFSDVVAASADSTLGEVGLVVIYPLPVDSQSRNLMAMGFVD